MNKEESINWNKLTIEEVQEVLALNALKIFRLTQENQKLTDRLYAIELTREDYKREAGYGKEKCFEMVWTEVLWKAKKYDELLREKAND